MDTSLDQSNPDHLPETSQAIIGRYRGCKVTIEPDSAFPESPYYMAEVDYGAGREPVTVETGDRESDYTKKLESVYLWIDLDLDRERSNKIRGQFRGIEIFACCDCEMDGEMRLMCEVFSPRQAVLQTALLMTEHSEVIAKVKADNQGCNDFEIFPCSLEAHYSNAFPSFADFQADPRLLAQYADHAWNVWADATDGGWKQMSEIVASI